jgi:putative transposase
VLVKAVDTFKQPTTAPNQLWQIGYAYLQVSDWGWFDLSTVLDGDSRYLLAWKLCDVNETLELALDRRGFDRATVSSRPRQLSYNGPSYLSVELKHWLDSHGMGTRVRSAVSCEDTGRNRTLVLLR